MSKLETPPEEQRTSKARLASVIILKAFVVVAIVQAIVAIAWSYNWVWVIMLWTMIVLVAVELILVVAILIADGYRLTQVNQHIHETPPEGSRGDS